MYFNRLCHGLVCLAWYPYAVDSRPCLYWHWRPSCRPWPSGVTDVFPQVPAYCQSRHTAIFLAADMFQASYGFSSPLVLPETNSGSCWNTRLTMRTISVWSCRAPQWCAAIQCASSHTVRPVINYMYIYRLIRYGCVYTLQRNYMGYQRLRYNTFIIYY